MNTVDNSIQGERKDCKYKENLSLELPYYSHQCFGFKENQ